MNRFQVLALALAVGVLAAPALAQDEAEADGENWHTVQAGPFAVRVNLDGVVASERTWPVRVELEEYQTGSLELLEGVDQGKRVAEGDVLLRFDPEPLEQQIADREKSLAVTDASIAQTRESLRLDREAYERELAAAERDAARAEADFDRWHEIERPLQREGAEVSLASAQQRLDNAQEELEQLQKMYRDEDLTEESEEIVLRRQQHEVRVAEFSLKREEQEYEQTLSVDLARRDEDIQARLERAQASLERAREVKPRELEQSQQRLEQQLHDRAKSARELEGLREDLERLTVTAPADGVVFYGREHRGQWSDGEAIGQSMREGGGFKAGGVIVTIVDPAALRVRARVPEEALHHFVKNRDNGLSGYVQPTAFPNVTIPAAAVELTQVTGADYDAVIAVDGDADHADRLKPGLNVKIKLTAYEADEAISIPASVVQHAADGSPYVELRTEGDDTERREISLGWHGGDRVEVTEGLATGDEVKLQVSP